MGAGPIGLVCLLSARVCGATQIIVADIQDSKLEKAKELGADLVLRSDDSDFLALCRLTGLVDVSIDASGAETAIRSCIYVTKPGGKFISIGRGLTSDVNCPLFEAADKQIDVMGVFRYKNMYSKAIALVANGTINLEPLITHRFSLNSVDEALHVAMTGREGAIKVTVNL